MCLHIYEDICHVLVHTNSHACIVKIHTCNAAASSETIRCGGSFYSMSLSPPVVCAPQALGPPWVDRLRKPGRGWARKLPAKVEGTQRIKPPFLDTDTGTRRVLGTRPYTCRQVQQKKDASTPRSATDPQTAQEVCRSLSRPRAANATRKTGIPGGARCRGFPTTGARPQVAPRPEAPGVWIPRKSRSYRFHGHLV